MDDMRNEAERIRQQFNDARREAARQYMFVRSMRAHKQAIIDNARIAFSRYEYMEVPRSEIANLGGLNALGQEGWQLAGIVQDVQPVYVFARSIREPFGRPYQHLDEKAAQGAEIAEESVARGLDLVRRLYDLDRTLDVPDAERVSAHVLLVTCPALGPGQGYREAVSYIQDAGGMVFGYTHNPVWRNLDGRVPANVVLREKQIAVDLEVVSDQSEAVSALRLLIRNAPSEARVLDIAPEEVRLLEVAPDTYEVPDEPLLQELEDGRTVVLKMRLSEE